MSQLAKLRSLAAFALLGAGCGDDSGSGSAATESGSSAGTQDADDGGTTDTGGDGGTTSSGGAATGAEDADDTSQSDGSESDGGSGSGGPVGPEPIIPEPDGECPEFVTGTQTIGALETSITAGTPGDVQGPLLLYWHGTNSSPGIEVPGLLPPAQREAIMAQGGLIIAPISNGEDRGGFSPNGVWYEGTDGVGGDLDWVDHVAACAVQNHNIDPRRIYTTGCSAGGLMTAGLALKRSNYIAAAAPNSGGIVFGGADLLQDPQRVPSMMTMHGGASDNVGVNFGQTSAMLDDVVVGAGGFAVDCNHMSGHCTAPADVRTAAWEFLDAHPYGTAPSPYASELPASFPDYCEIWTGS